MERFNTRNQNRRDAILNVLKAIEALMAAQNGHLSDYPSTRDIANRCNLSIYSTCHILLLLKSKGIIDVVKGKHAKYLYWRRTKAPGLNIN